MFHTNRYKEFITDYKETETTNKNNPTKTRGRERVTREIEHERK